MGYRLGIDLGTTYTAAAIARDGRAEMLALGDRSPIIPSVVAIREDGTVLTGEAAERRVSIEPDRVAREFKRRFGDPAPFLLGGAPYGAETLQAHMLKAVVAKATEREGEAPDRIGLTFPANWGPYKLELVDQVVALAGLDPESVDLLSEPEAAAIHYASQQRVEPGALVAVYDLGGGTFDAAVLRRTTTGYEIAGPPSGIERLGGIDLDAAVFGFVQGQLGEAADVDPDDPDAMAALAGLRRDCVAGKEALAADTDTEIVAMLPGVHERIRLTRAEFEDMARPAIRQTVDALQRAVVAAGVAPGDLASVLLVGGSSRIPLVAQEVGNAIGRPVAVDTHPKYAVALGAALAGDELVEDVVIAEPEVIPIPVIAPLAGAAAAAAAPPPATPPAAPPPPTAGPSAPAPAAVPQPAPSTAAPPGPPGDERKGRGALVAAVVVVLAVVAAAAGFALFGGSADASELVLEAKGSLGDDPFSNQPGLAGNPPEVTPVTFDTGGASGDTIVVSQRGTAPGLYGGTRQVGECDPDLLVEFLQANPDKAAAWASTQGIDVADIADFVGGLTSVTLLSDTRVTNHGFSGGQANSLQSVLEAGTAVLVDEFGIPRVKCNCGNPLLEPATISGSVTTVGTPWPDFDATRLIAVTPGNLAVSRVVLTDLNGGDPFSRGVGTNGADDIECDDACGLPLAGGSSTTSSSTTSTTSSTTSTSEAALAPIDITQDGSVTADSTFEDDPVFASCFAIDADVETSWFSDGPERDGSSRLTWSLRSGTAQIDIIEVIGNGDNSNPQFRNDFGFGEVEIRVLRSGQEVFSAVAQLSGTPDPTVAVLPEVEGDVIELVFTGHEDPTCGGIGELLVTGATL